MAVLVTGGAGYIGSHSVLELIDGGEEIIVVDNFCNSDKSTVDKIQSICGKQITFYECDITNGQALTKVFEEHNIESVVHFAALKAVGDSVSVPLQYYHNNVGGTINLLQIMHKYNCKRLVFSSSAAVYGIVGSPIDESTSKSPINPYGMTKSMCEDIIIDFVKSTDMSAINLRYFNPIGAHSSGLLGESPKGLPTNIMPVIGRVARGMAPYLDVFGDDYDTVDGSCIRDYIHVVDIAQGHLSALDYIRKNKGVRAVNLGTGTGISVLQLINTFQRVNSVNIKYKIAGRRVGDPAQLYAGVSLAQELLGWRAKLDIERACQDYYNFLKQT